MSRYSSVIQFISLATILISSVAAQSGTWVIDTIAGATRPVNDGPGSSALLNSPVGTVVDAAGNVLFADAGNHRIRQVSPNGTVSTIVGTGIAGNSGDGGPALGAQLLSPAGLALDSSGNLFIADYLANVVRKVSADGTISTVAGNGLPGSTLGGTATTSTLNAPWALALDKNGVLYVSEDFNGTVRKVLPDGSISNLTPTKLAYAEGLAVDSEGNVYVASWFDNKIYKVTGAGVTSVFAGTGRLAFSGDGGLASSAALNSPQGIALDSAGNLWICDTGNQRIRRVGTDGKIQTIIGSGTKGLSNIASDPTSASLFTPAGIAVDTRGFVYWAETGNNRIRSYNPGNRQVLDIAGYSPALNSGSSATTLVLANPYGTSSDSAGNLYIADTRNNIIRKITAAGVPSIFAGTGQPSFNGDVGTATAINLAEPRGVSVDAQGIVWIADSGNGRVRKVDLTGRITTVMGSGTGLPFNGTFAGNSFLLYPIAVLGLGNNSFAVLDQLFGVVERVDSVGTITILPQAAGTFLLFPRGIAVSGTTTYIADTLNSRILKNEGTTTTVFAGTGALGYTGDSGAANKATFYLPSGVAVDSSGNVYIADTGNNVIRVVDTKGTINTLAGTGKPGFSGDKGPALNALLAGPTSVQVDGAGNINVTDLGNQRVRQLQFRQLPPGITLSLDATARSANHGSPVSFTITVASEGGYAGPANLTVSAPAGVTFQFTPAVPLTLTANQSVLVTATAQIPVTASPSSSSITFNVTAGSIQRSISATLDITNLPQFTSAGVVSGASGIGGGISPGQIIALYGQDLGPATISLGAFDAAGILSTTAGGTQVLFDGKPAPILYALTGQVSAIVPYSVAGKATTLVQTIYAGQKSPVISVNVVDAAPAVFNSPGISQAAAQNFDLSLNSSSNPAEAGSIVVLYATGEGATTPTGVDGKQATEVFPAPTLPVTVTIGGQKAEILYAGAAPFLVAGVMQINARIAAGVASGPAAVVLTVGSRVSTGTSTIAVK